MKTTQAEPLPIKIGEAYITPEIVKTVAFFQQGENEDLYTFCNAIKGVISFILTLHTKAGISAEDASSALDNLSFLQDLNETIKTFEYKPEKQQR
jgi:hypothetical protein